MLDSIKNTYDSIAQGGMLASDFETANHAFQARYRTGVTKTSEDVARSAQAVETQNKISAGSVSGTIGSFGEMLKGEMQKVNQLQLNSESNMQDYATGGEIPLHQVMLSVNKAEMSLKLATQVRNKIVTAYQDISRMQI